MSSAPLPSSPAAAAPTFTLPARRVLLPVLLLTMLVQCGLAPLSALARNAWCRDTSMLLCIEALGALDGDEQRLQHLRSRCDAFDGEACDRGATLAEEMLGEGAPEAIGLLRWGCGLSVGRSCFRLGRRRQHGRGVPLSIDAATNLFRRACDLDVANGCGRLGTLLEGRGHDVDAAWEVYRRACELGAERSCLDLRRLEERWAPRR